MERSIAVWRPEIANSSAEATLCENTFYYIQILSKLHWNKWKWQKNMNLCSILFTFEKYMYFSLVKWSHRLWKKDKRKQSMSLHKIFELKNGRQRNDNLIVFVDTLSIHLTVHMWMIRTFPVLSFFSLAVRRSLREHSHAISFSLVYVVRILLHNHVIRCLYTTHSLVLTFVRQLSCAQLSEFFFPLLFPHAMRLILLKHNIIR